MFPNWALASLALAKQVSFPCPRRNEILKETAATRFGPGIYCIIFRALLAWNWECRRGKAGGILWGGYGTEGGLPVGPPSRLHLLIVTNLEDNKVFLSSKCLSSFLGLADAWPGAGEWQERPVEGKWCWGRRDILAHLVFKVPLCIALSCVAGTQQ